MPYPIFHPSSEQPPPLFLTLADFRSRFSGESEYVEFEEGVSRERIREAVVGFSNADGGVVPVGITDRADVRGVPDVGDADRRIRDALTDVHNPGRYEIQSLQVGDSAVVVLSVARRREGFSR